MEENRKKFNWKTVIIVIMAFLLLFCLAKINEFTDKNEDLNREIRNLSNRITSLQNEINSIYENVDKQLKKEASLHSGVNYSVGELNFEDSTVGIDISVVPKAFTDDMKMSVSVDSKTVELVKNENSYAGTLNVGLFLEYEQWPLLTIKTDAGTKTEFLEDVDISNLFSSFLPIVNVDLGGSGKYANNKLSADLVFSIDGKPASKDSVVTFTTFTLIEEVNGKEISNVDITDKINQDRNSYTVTYNKDFKVSKGDSLKVYLLAEDSLGYIHKTLAYSWYENDDGAVAEAVYGGESIYDKNGTLLYGEKQ